MVHLNDL